MTTTIAFVALVVALIALTIVLVTERRIHTSVKRDVELGIGAWVANFSNDVNRVVPQLVQAKVNDAVAAANIPGVVEAEVKKHQQGALLIEGQQETK